MDSVTTTNKTVNIREAIYQFLCTFCAPKVEPENVIWGNQNNLTLPDCEDFVIFTITSNQRRGTGVESWSKIGTDETVSLQELVECSVQVDCYASSESGMDGMEAMLRAQSIEHVSRSTVGVESLRRLGVGLLYADDARDATGIGDSDRYDRRWITTLHLSFVSDLSVSQDFFTGATVAVKNVDVHFKP